MALSLIKTGSTAQVKNDAENLSTNSVKLESVIVSLEFVLNEVMQHWEQTQEDAQSFKDGLQNNIETLKSIKECNLEFSTAITKYAEAQETTGSKTMV